MRALEEIIVSVEEAEAIRLKDIEGLEQEQGAERMSVSRPTFQRILESARHKIAEALLHGKAIKIEGGNFEMITRRFRCIRGHEWDVPFDAMQAGHTQLCPACSMPDITTPSPQTGNQRRINRGKPASSGI